MDNNNNIDPQNSSRKGKVLAGIILLAIGASLLFNQLDIFFLPGWLFGPSTWFIIGGLYIGARNNFRNIIWIILVMIGASMTLHHIIPGYNSGTLFWPVGIIGLGIYLILKRNNPNHNYWDKKAWKNKWEHSKYDFGNPTPINPNEPVVDYTIPGSQPTEPVNLVNHSGDDFLDAVSIFGGVKKMIFSKNFQGGDIINVFGGAELDFTQADINGRVYIDVTQIFGGIKLIVPAHWMVVSDVAAVFAGFDDKRIRTSAPLDNNKVLVLKGTSIFAGVDIRSY